MKRSRAVEIINRKIEGYMNPGSSRHVADLILMDLEEAGLVQPPFNKKLAESIHYIGDYYVWETEDEEK